LKKIGLSPNGVYLFQGRGNLVKDASPTYNTLYLMRTNFTPEELTITDKTDLGTNYAETFVFMPASKDEEELGSLFITAEVASNKSKKENAELISEMAIVVKNEYYKNTLVTPLSALKFSLKRANGFLANKKAWLAPAVSLKFRVLISSLKENKLHLARLGETSAFILRNGNLQSITSHVNNPKNTAALSFENIISGELLANDHIVLATHQIHKIDENELAAKLQEKKLVDHLKKVDSGIKSLAMITLYPFSPINPLISRKRDELGERGEKEKRKK